MVIFFTYTATPLPAKINFYEMLGAIFSFLLLLDATGNEKITKCVWSSAKWSFDLTVKFLTAFSLHSCSSILLSWVNF